MTVPDLTPCKQDPKLLERMAIATDHGMLMAMFGLGAELYVVPREVNQQRREMIQLQTDYYLRFKQQLDRVLIDSATTDSRIVELQDEGLLRFDHVDENWPKNQAFTSVVFKHYVHPDYPRQAGTVSPYVSNFLVRPEKDPKRRLSFYECYIPVADPNGKLNFKTLIDCLCRWAEILHPAHGSAGYCVIYELATETAHRYVHAALQRYPGLDIHEPGSFAWDGAVLHDRIKCVNWLTVLGDEVLGQLGGLEVARKALEPDCTFHPYEGGVVIQAGEAPQLGDTYQGDVPEVYRKVARFTKPVRFEAYRSSLFKVFEPMDGKEEAVRWVRRFD